MRSTTPTQVFQMAEFEPAVRLLHRVGALLSENEISERDDLVINVGFLIFEARVIITLIEEIDCKSRNESSSPPTWIMLLRVGKPIKIRSMSHHEIKIIV